MFNNIYKEYSLFTGIVANYIGADSPFVEDIVSDAIIKIYEGIESGSIDKEKICEDGSIKVGFFRKTVTNAAIDFKRKKRNTSDVYLSHIDLEIESPIEDINNNIEVIHKHLEQFEKVSLCNKFHADVFKYFFFEGINLSKLSKATGIGRKTLIESKKLMINNCREWLRKERVEV